MLCDVTLQRNLQERPAPDNIFRAELLSVSAADNMCLGRVLKFFKDARTIAERHVTSIG